MSDYREKLVLPMVLNPPLRDPVSTQPLAMPAPTTPMTCVNTEQLVTRDIEKFYNNSVGDGDDERPGNVWSRSGCLDDKKGDDDDNEDDCLSCISVWELTQHCLR